MDLSPLALQFPAAPALPPVGPAAVAPDAPQYDETHLILDEDGQEALASRVKSRIDECRKDMGLSLTLSRPMTAAIGASGWGSSYWSSSIGSQTDSWAFKREINQKFYDGDLGWRETYYPQPNVFQTSNYSLSAAKNLANHPA